MIGDTTLLGRGEISRPFLVKQALLLSSIIHGGGKRRMGVMIAPFPLCAERNRW